MSWLTEPFAFAFFARALVAGVLVGALCGRVGVFVVQRRMSYIGHGLAHSVLGGAVVGVALGQNLYLGAAVATLLAALLIDRVTRRRGLHADAAIGIVTTTMFAAGVAVLSFLPGSAVNAESLLFGNILTIGPSDLLLAAGVTLGFGAVLFSFYKPLVFVSFDAAVAAVHGVRVGLTEALFHVMTAAVVVVSVRVLGVLLVAAAVVIPAAIARLLSHSLPTMLAVAAATGVAASVVGLYVSFHADIASGPAIVLTGAALFALVAGVTAVGARSERTKGRRPASVGGPVR